MVATHEPKPAVAKRNPVPVRQSLPIHVAMSDEELARIDPLVLNLQVAKGIPALAELNICRYQELADEWAAGVQRLITKAQGHFWRNPSGWKNDIHFFHLGVLCEYVERELGVAYREDQRDLTAIRYTDPSHLFLNGVMDTRRGTCGNLAALHVALGWRLGWPVSLACVGSHFICRYDDGEVTHNIEATQSDYGGFKSDPDEFLIQQHRLPPQALRSGSDLRAVSPREMLGLFVGLRARHLRDVSQLAAAERDLLLARYLFPANRTNSREQIAASCEANIGRFERDEPGHPMTLWALGNEILGKQPASTSSMRPPEAPASLSVFSTAPFIGQGTIGFRAGDANLYRYVGNNATNEVDPSGLEPPKVKPYPKLTLPRPEKFIPQGPPGSDPLEDYTDTERALLRALSTNGTPGFTFQFQFGTPTGWDNAGRYFLQAIRTRTFLFDTDAKAYDLPKSDKSHWRYVIDQVRVDPTAKVVEDTHIREGYSLPGGKKISLLIHEVDAVFGPSKTATYVPVKNDQGKFVTMLSCGEDDYKQVLGEIHIPPKQENVYRYKYLYIFYQPVQGLGQKDFAAGLKKLDPGLDLDAILSLKQFDGGLGANNKPITLGKEAFSAILFPAIEGTSKTTLRATLPR